MKMKLFFSVVLVCMLAMGLMFAGCGTTSTAAAASAAIDFPEDLQGTWGQLGGMMSSSFIEISGSTMRYTVNVANFESDQSDTFTFTFTLNSVVMNEDVFELTGRVSASNHFRMTNGETKTIGMVLTDDYDSGALIFFDAIDDDDAYGGMFVRTFG